MSYAYTSRFASSINDMRRFRGSLGFSEGTYASELFNFDQYCTTHYPDAVTLTEEIVMKWGKRRDSEKINGFKHRLIALRQFGKYLNFKEKVAYVIPVDLIGKYETYYPYLFTDEEILTFFEEVDNIVLSRQVPFTEFTVPVFFRLAYACGLRPNELRDLRRYDVDYKSGTLFIYDSKKRKDRILSITPDLAELCLKYDRLAESRYPNRPWFLQISVKDSHRRRWISNQLRKYWNKSGLFKKSGRYPRVSDFRHNYATRILMKWFDEGKDIMVMLPYLSAYMGHAEFQSTAYYIHLLPERLRNNNSFDWYGFEDLIPEVTHEK